jgi:hypothetical protein
MRTLIVVRLAFQYGLLLNNLFYLLLVAGVLIDIALAVDVTGW